MLEVPDVKYPNGERAYDKWGRKKMSLLKKKQLVKTIAKYIYK
jgi:hypothetical protein